MLSALASLARKLLTQTLTQHAAVWEHWREPGAPLHHVATCSAHAASVDQARASLGAQGLK